MLIDHIWAWRADHGVPGSVGWDVNTGRNGVVVNGDDVTATGLFVEHYQQYNVVWNGEGGRTVFFQNELPYDPPNQAAWQHDGIARLGRVQGGRRRARRTSSGAAARTSSPTSTRRSTPRAASRCRSRRASGCTTCMTVNLSAGTIDHVVNDTGAPATTATPARRASSISSRDDGERVARVVRW